MAVLVLYNGASLIVLGSVINGRLNDANLEIFSGGGIAFKPSESADDVISRIQPHKIHLQWENSTAPLLLIIGKDKIFYIERPSSKRFDESNQTIEPAPNIPTAHPPPSSVIKHTTSTPPRPIQPPAPIQTLPTAAVPKPTEVETSISPPQQQIEQTPADDFSDDDEFQLSNEPVLPQTFSETASQAYPETLEVSAQTTPQVTETASQVQPITAELPTQTEIFVEPILDPARLSTPAASITKTSIAIAMGVLGKKYFKSTGPAVNSARKFVSDTFMKAVLNDPRGDLLLESPISLDNLYASIVGQRLTLTAPPKTVSEEAYLKITNLLNMSINSPMVLKLTPDILSLYNTAADGNVPAIAAAYNALQNKLRLLISEEQYTSYVIQAYQELIRPPENSEASAQTEPFDTFTQETQTDLNVQELEESLAKAQAEQQALKLNGNLSAERNLELEREMSQLYNQLASRQAQNSELENNLSAMKTSHDSELERLLAEGQNKTLEHNAQIKTLNNKLARLSNNVSLKEEQIKSSSSGIAEKHQAEIDALNKKMKALEEEKKSAVSNLAETRADLSARLQAATGEYEESRNTSETRLSKMRSLVQVYSESATALKKESASRAKEFNELTQENLNMKSKLSELLSAQQIGVERLNADKAEIETLKGQRDSARSTSSDTSAALTKQLNDKVAQYNEKQRELTAANSNYQMYKSKFAEQERALNRLKSQIKDEQENSAAITNEAGKLEARLNNTISSLTSELQTAKTQASNSQVESLETQSALKEKMAAMQENFNLVKHELAETQNKLQDLESRPPPPALKPPNSSGLSIPNIRRFVKKIKELKNILTQYDREYKTLNDKYYKLTAQDDTVKIDVATNTENDGDDGGVKDAVEEIGEMIVGGEIEQAGETMLDSIIIRQKLKSTTLKYLQSGNVKTSRRISNLTSNNNGYSISNLAELNSSLSINGEQTIFENNILSKYPSTFNTTQQIPIAMTPEETNEGVSGMQTAPPTMTKIIQSELDDIEAHNIGEPLVENTQGMLNSVPLALLPTPVPPEYLSVAATLISNPSGLALENFYKAGEKNKREEHADTLNELVQAMHHIYSTVQIQPISPKTYQPPEDLMQALIDDPRFSQVSPTALKNLLYHSQNVWRPIYEHVPTPESEYILDATDNYYLLKLGRLLNRAVGKNLQTYLQANLNTRQRVGEGDSNTARQILGALIEQNLPLTDFYTRELESLISSWESHRTSNIRLSIMNPEQAYTIANEYFDGHPEVMQITTGPSSTPFENLSPEQRLQRHLQNVSPWELNQVYTNPNQQQQAVLDLIMAQNTGVLHQNQITPGDISNFLSGEDSISQNLNPMFATDLTARGNISSQPQNLINTSMPWIMLGAVIASKVASYFYGKKPNYESSANAPSPPPPSNTNPRLEQARLAYDNLNRFVRNSPHKTRANTQQMNELARLALESKQKYEQRPSGSQLLIDYAGKWKDDPYTPIPESFRDPDDEPYDEFSDIDQIDE